MATLESRQLLLKGSTIFLLCGAVLGLLFSQATPVIAGPPAQETEFLLS